MPVLIYLSSIINSNNINLLSTPILLTNNSTVIPLIQTLKGGIYMAKYSARDSSGNLSTITRQINIQYPSVFNVSYGSFAPVNRNFTVMNNTDWTCELWLNMTSYNTSDYTPIFDFEDYPGRANTNGARQGTFNLCILQNTNTLGFFGYSNGNSYTIANFSDIA